MTELEELDDLRKLKRLEELEAAERAADPGPGRRKAAVSGAATGLVGGTAGMVGDVADLRTMAMDKMGVPKFLQMSPINLFPSTERILSTADQVLGTELDYEPKTTEEKFAKSVSSGVTGAALPGGKLKMLTRAIMGGLAGGAGEAVEQASGSKVAGVLTNVAAMLGLGAAGSRKPQAVKAAQKDLENIDQDKLIAGDAKATQIEKETGVRPVLAQTLDDPTALSGITDQVSRSQHGQKIQARLSEEAAAGRKLVKDTIEGVSDRQLGQRDANEVLTAGGKAIDRPKAVAKSAAERDYRRGKRDVLPNGGDRAQADFVATTPEGVKAGPAGRVFDASPVEGDRTNWKVHRTTSDDLIKRLYAESERLDMDTPKGGKPFTDAAEEIAALQRKYKDGIPLGKIDVIERRVRDLSLAADKPGASDKLVRQKLAHDGVAGVLNAVIKETSEGMTKGKQTYSTMARGYGKAVNESPLPTMFTEEARKSGIGNFDQMSKVLTNSSAYKPEDIAFVAKNLQRADPEAFPMLVKHSWSTALDNASKTVEGRTPRQSLDRWVNEVAGAPGSKARENATEAYAWVARSRGDDPNLAKAAINKVFDTIHTFARDNASLGRIDTGEFANAAGRSVGSSVMRSIGLVPQFAMARALETVQRKQVYEQLADALLSPGGYKKLLEIAQFDPTLVKLEEYTRSLLQSNAYADAQ